MESQRGRIHAVDRWPISCARFARAVEPILIFQRFLPFVPRSLCEYGAVIFKNVLPITDVFNRPYHNFASFEIPETKKNYHFFGREWTGK